MPADRRCAITATRMAHRADSKIRLRFMIALGGYVREPGAAAKYGVYCMQDVRVSTVRAASVELAQCAVRSLKAALVLMMMTLKNITANPPARNNWFAAQSPFTDASFPD